MVASAYQQQRKYVEACLEDEKRDLLKQKTFFKKRRIGINHPSNSEVDMLRVRLNKPWLERWANFREAFLAWDNPFCVEMERFQRLRTPFFFFFSFILFFY